MKMLNYLRFFTIFFWAFGTTLAAQDLDLQRLLQNDPNLKAQIDAFSSSNAKHD
jgi:hypothetical protein